MPEGRPAKRAPTEGATVAEIVARCGNIYTHFRLSAADGVEGRPEHCGRLSLEMISCRLRII